MEIKNLTIDKHAKIKEAVEKIILNDLRIVFVTNNEKIVGSVSEGDILRSILYTKNLENPIELIMNKSFKFFSNKKNKKDIKKYFLDHDILVLPIVDKKLKLIDVVTYKDYL